MRDKRFRTPSNGTVRATRYSMPFFDHRTMAEVIEEENRDAILKDLGRGPKVNAR